MVFLPTVFETATLAVTPRRHTVFSAPGPADALHSGLVAQPHWLMVGPPEPLLLSMRLAHRLLFIDTGLGLLENHGTFHPCAGTSVASVKI